MDSLDNLPYASGEGNEDFEIAMEDLTIMSGWTKFLSILGFVLIGILCLASLVDLAISPKGLAGSIVILIFIALLFFPIRNLLRFSREVRRYRETMDMSALEMAFQYIKSFWVYSGVLFILYLLVSMIKVLMTASEMEFYYG